MTRDNTTTTTGTTNIIPVRVDDSRTVPDLSSATITYRITDYYGSDTVVELTDSDSTVYTDSTQLDAELKEMLGDIADDIDTADGKFVVEVPAADIPDTGTYYEELILEWPSGRTFTAGPRKLDITEHTA